MKNTSMLSRKKKQPKDNTPSNAIVKKAVFLMIWFRRLLFPDAKIYEIAGCMPIQSPIATMEINIDTIPAIPWQPPL